MSYLEQLKKLPRPDPLDWVKDTLQICQDTGLTQPTLPTTYTGPTVGDVVTHVTAGGKKAVAGGKSKVREILRGLRK